MSSSCRNSDEEEIFANDNVDNSDEPLNFSTSIRLECFPSNCASSFDAKTKLANPTKFVDVEKTREFLNQTIPRSLGNQLFSNTVGYPSGIFTSAPLMSSAYFPNFAAAAALIKSSTENIVETSPITTISVNSYPEQNGSTVGVMNAASKSVPHTQSRNGSPALCCAVCGDVSSGKHYGILACNGCSGFFKRSVRRRLIYRCQAATGKCVVDKGHRNQCQACRLKKCLYNGMNKDAVQNERQPRNTATIRPPIGVDFANSTSEQFFRDYTDVVSAAVGVLNNDTNQSKSNSSNDLPSRRFPFTSSSEKSLPTKSIEDLDEEDMSVEKGESVSLITWNDFKNRPLFGTPSPAHETTHETSARLLFLTIKWAKHLPSFMSLPFRDQMILLEEGWSDLFLLSVFQWSLPFASCPLLSSSSSSLFPDPAVILPVDLRYLHHLFVQIRSLHLDQGEIACLKALVLFRPANARRLEELHQVEFLQDQAQSMLVQHTGREMSGNSPMRFGRLLLLLPLLKKVSAEKIEKFFFQRTFGNIPMEKMLCDMYKS